jgi:hypothetical protein
MLTHVPLDGAVRRGQRPPRLDLTKTGIAAGDVAHAFKNGMP